MAALPIPGIETNFVLAKLAMSRGKDKLGDMDVSLNFPTRCKRPLILQGNSDLMGGQYFRSKGAR